MAMTRDAIIRELRRFQHDPYYRGERRVPILPFAQYCGMSRQMIYDIINKRRRIGKRSIAHVTAAVEAVMAGRLRFERIGNEWRALTSTFNQEPGYAAPANGDRPNANSQLGVLEQAVSARLRQ